MGDLLLEIIEVLISFFRGTPESRARMLRQQFAPGMQPVAVDVSLPAAAPPAVAAPVRRPAPPPAFDALQDAAPPRAIPAIDLHQLFSEPGGLVRGVVAAEILGPPAALRRHNPWDVPGVP